MNDELDQFGRVWCAVREEYDSGHIVYERGLQAGLYMELSREFPDRSIVVEPHWEPADEAGVRSQRIPDMVILQSGCITDIFELKFAPHWYPRFHGDISKLREYEGMQCQPVTLNPLTGRLDDPSPICTDCRLHFLVVAQRDAKAVWPEWVSDQIVLWYGRIHKDGNEWGICRGESTE